jgi:hypothetical protein
MGTDEISKNGTPRLVLDYIKVFMWPMVLLIVILFYKEDVSKILNERQIEIAGLKLGPRVAEIKENVQVELEDIRKLVKEIQSSSSESSKVSSVSKDIITRIDGLNTGIDKEISLLRQEAGNVQQSSKQNLPTTSDNKSMARIWEAKGFEFLVTKDIDLAIDAFTKAEGFWGDYHNVAEIKRLLIKNRDKLIESKNTVEDGPWKHLYKTLLSKYSWGMPMDVRVKLRE